MNIKDIKTIGFYGDSFTFGQYLDFYDYGMTPCEKNKSCNNENHFRPEFTTLQNRKNSDIHISEYHAYPLFDNLLYKESLIYSEWYKRFNSIVERRFSSQVGKRLNLNVIAPRYNGVGNKSILENTQEDTISDLKIVMLSSCSRDEWDNKEWSISDYYNDLFNSFSKIKNVRFIGSWTEEESSILPSKYHQDRLIPIMGYESIYSLRRNTSSGFKTKYEVVKPTDKIYAIGEDFPIDDDHPSQELHDIITDSICEYLV